MTTADDWPRCRPLIVAALETSQHLETIEQTEANIASGLYQFWAGEKSAAVTTVEPYPNRRLLKVVHVGGDLQEIKALEPTLCAFAHQSGCDGILFEGRAGWKREMVGLGYRFATLTMIKDL